MEYLSLQDIPQRHSHSVHSHRMPSHSAERSLGHMAAAVREDSVPSLPDFSAPLVLHPPNPSNPTYGYADRERQASRSGETYAALQHIELPESPASAPSAPASPHSPRRSTFKPRQNDSLFTYSLNGDMQGRRRMKLVELLNSTVTNSANPSQQKQNHNMRNSPPLQPGEQAFPGKLPSFDEFVQTTIERTPPHTPSRRIGSAEASPRARPLFDDVAWSESSRKRVDTLGDIYAARPSNASEYPPSDIRRMSSAVVDPALYQSQPESMRQRQLSAGPAHHRPSLPFPPIPSAAGHSRHQSTPHAGHATYQQTPPPSHSQAHYPHPHAQPQPQVVYERRPSYYQEAPPPAQTYPYENQRDSYYQRSSFAAPAHPGYEHGYPQTQYDVRFQQHVGLDHNAFNRKRRGNLPKEATNYLKAWFARNRASPYPTEDQKIEMCRDTGLSLNQVSNWFINARRRAPGKDQRERDVSKD